ncbi:hypothetical protein E4U41_006681, partial [Claviceps citrina]
TVDWLLGTTSLRLTGLWLRRRRKPRPLGCGGDMLLAADFWQALRLASNESIRLGALKPQSSSPEKPRALKRS